MRLGVGGASQMIFARLGKIIWTLYLGVPQVQGLGGCSVAGARLPKAERLPLLGANWETSSFTIKTETAEPAKGSSSWKPNRTRVRNTRPSLCNWRHDPRTTAPQPRGCQRCLTEGLWTICLTHDIAKVRGELGLVARLGQEVSQIGPSHAAIRA